jgi:adenylate cyclase
MLLSNVSNNAHAIIGILQARAGREQDMAADGKINEQMRRRWRLVAILTLIGAAFGLGYTLLRMAGGVMPLALSELEHATRTGTFIGFCLGIFMVFHVYDQRGAAIRRLSFLAGWVVIDGASTLIIAVAILVQRGATALVRSELGFFTDYLNGGFGLDVLIAFLIFVVVALFMQIRPLLGPGTMWKVVTGRYHQPRKERRIYMFLDIKNSTAMAGRLGDERTHALISEVFFDADRRVAEYGGEVLNYNGDEIVATWLEADRQGNGRCLQCYRDITQALAAKAASYDERFGVHPEFWAGFHAGAVVVGECGDGKRAIVHIGDTPNIAARLEQLAKDMGHDCLISASLLAALEMPANLKAVALGAVILKGHEHDTEIYALEPA